MGKWTIEARSLSIVGGAASHNFWVLRNDKGEAVAELHGLATDRKTGATVPIGTDAEKHSLRVKQFIHDPEYARNFGAKQANSTYIKDGQTSDTVFSGSREEVLERWKAGAKTAATRINALDLDYPPGGFKFDGTTRNSNSVYRTLGAIMVGEANVPVFKNVLQPGVNNHVLDPALRQLIQYDRPGRDPNSDRLAGLDSERLPSANAVSTNALSINATATLVPGNEAVNRQFTQALQGTNGDRDTAAAAIETLRNTQGYKIDQDIAVLQGRNGQFIASQGQGDTALNVAVAKANPGEFERVAHMIAQTPQPAQMAAAQPEPSERARMV